MNEYERLTNGRYGALELKRFVGPNLIRGLVVSVMLHGALISLPFAATALHGAKPPITKAGVEGPIIILPPWEEVPKENRGIPRPPRPESPISKNWVPDPDEDFVDTTGVKTPSGPKGHDLPSDTGGDGGYSSGGNSSGDFTEFEPPEDAIPPDTVFTPFEIAPQKLPGLCPVPAYPELAQIARMAGKVMVYVYVDRLGNVRKWKIMQANPSGLGFEDEVLKVIPKWKFTPAIQQGRAVGVWVAVPVTFEFSK
jgi:TonB family protein